VCQRLRRLSPWLIALAIFLAAWEAITAKLGLLPLPFFPPPRLAEDQPGMERAVAYRPTYNFTIGVTERKVTEACAAYLALLQRMVADFAAANP
jgi:hypothetical protein